MCSDILKNIINSIKQNINNKEKTPKKHFKNKKKT